MFVVRRLSHVVRLPRSSCTGTGDTAGDIDRPIELRRFREGALQEVDEFRSVSERSLRCGPSLPSRPSGKGMPRFVRVATIWTATTVVLRARRVRRAGGGEIVAHLSSRRTAFVQSPTEPSPYTSVIATEA